MVLTEDSTKVGTSKRAASQSRVEKSSQPGASPTPMPRTAAGSTRAVASNSRNRSATRPSSPSGGSSMPRRHDPLRPRRTGQIADRHARARVTYIGGEHEPGALVEDDRGGRAPAGGRMPIYLAN